MDIMSKLPKNRQQYQQNNAIQNEIIEKKKDIRENAAILSTKEIKTRVYLLEMLETIKMIRLLWLWALSWAIRLLDLDMGHMSFYINVMTTFEWIHFHDVWHTIVLIHSALLCHIFFSFLFFLKSTIETI